MKKKKLTLGSVITIVLLLVIYFMLPVPEETPVSIVSLEDIPEYSAEPFVILEGNVPKFTESDYTTDSFEEYGALDALERCTYTVACIGQDLMPTGEREYIGQVKPTGWNTDSYDFIEGGRLYNRSHLIGFQLTGENANEKNLITGTRYFNAEAMEPFESTVADYITQTGNHVLYRVTPVFEESNPIASGAIMEGWSVEDEGAGICFCVFVYNVQPGVEIDYSTGESKMAPPVAAEGEVTEVYVVNLASGKYHEEDCPNWESIKDENRQSFDTTRSQMQAWNFVPAGCCD